MAQYDDGTVVFEGKEIEVGREIVDVLGYGEIVVVLLYVSPNEQHPTNVLAFDKDGNKVWEIESPPEEREQRSYKSLNVVDGNLRVTNWNGYGYRVDVDTGEVTETGYTR
ncbi:MULTISPECIES: hypothetical protein [Haloarcula]|uniref:Uncharacterized protein n=1 Tax=Haloarcula amylolytica JCM 13557 TaxID=1227452 RepID=M0K072_9EURY|nr:hypothetical protein [Haloarcula amylolytica]EMA14832.1 hypothetical protein C442_19861 [Haloarcula amylolytica JCM 13557]